MGRHDEAIAMFQRYVQLAPDEPNAHDSLGLGYEWAGRYEDAIREYQQALKLKADFEIAMVHLGNVYFQQGRYRAAIEEYQRYILAAPSNTELLRGYSCVGYVELSTGQVERAEVMVRQSLTRDKTANDLQYYIAVAKGDFAKAAKLKDAIESRPGNDRGLRPSLRPFYYRRGLLALKTGAVTEALEDFKLAISHRPQTWNLDAWEDCLANAYLELGRLDEATAEYQRVQKLNPNYPLLHYKLAQAYERKGRRDEARHEYQQFLNVWKDADADIPEVMAAKRALAL
jgi:tetratricopeptide (TPR) repeat protein